MAKRKKRQDKVSNRDPYFTSVPFYPHPVFRRVHSGAIEFYYRYYVLSSDTYLMDRVMEHWILENGDGRKIYAKNAAAFIQMWRGATHQKKREVVQDTLDFLFERKVTFDPLIQKSEARVIAEEV